MEMYFHFICSYFSQNYLLAIMLFQNIVMCIIKQTCCYPPPHETRKEKVWQKCNNIVIQQYMSISVKLQKRRQY